MIREAFGPNLRRIRMQRGISVDEIAAATKVSADLWRGLEANDFHRWPSGIFAREYIRQYARAIGVDPDATVDEFCRWFPQGDRRAGRLLQEHGEILDHAFSGEDHVLPVDGDRRGASPQRRVDVLHPESSVRALFLRLRRVFQRA